MHNVYAYFPMQIPTYDALICLSIQFHHTLNNSISHPLKFKAVVEPVAIN